MNPEVFKFANNWIDNQDRDRMPQQEMEASEKKSDSVHRHFKDVQMSPKKRQDTSEDITR